MVQTIFNQNNTGSPEAPQAYLVYLTFDESFNLIESKSGMLQATNPDALGELAVAHLNIETNGFVYIYVNNNSGYAVNFDNLRIAHKLANVMEVNNYYPYGLLNSSLSYSRSGNRYKYQTKEVDNFFDYNVLDFGARHYDAATARWTVYDPASQYATPYISMGGNPVSGIDPDGRQTRRSTDAEANLQQAQEQMGAVDNATGGGSGVVPWYYYSSRDVAAMQLQYGSTYEQQETDRVATLMSIGGYTAHDGTVYSYNSAGVAVKTVDMITQPTMNGQPVSSIGQKIGEATVPLDYFTNANAQVSSMNFSGYDFQLTFDFPIRNGSAQGSGGGDGGLGNWLSGFDLAVGVYSEYGHNHTTYTTTKGLVRNIFKPNGQIRSARSAGFARASRFVKGLGVAGSAISTAYTGIEINNALNASQEVSGWKYADFSIGFAGTTSGAILMTGLVTNPIGLGVLGVVGTGAMVYGGLRLGYQLIYEP